jgi:hypothetical protein
MAKTAKTDLGDAAAGLHSAHRADAAVDSAFSQLAPRDVDAERIGVIDERFDQRLRLGVDAWPPLLRGGDFFSFIHRLAPC